MTGSTTSTGGYSADSRNQTPDERLLATILAHEDLASDLYARAGGDLYTLRRMVETGTELDDLTGQQIDILNAAFTLGTRSLTPTTHRLKLQTAEDVIRSGPRLAALAQEELHVLLVNPKLELFDQRMIYRGTFRHMRIAPGEILRYALTYQAAGFFMMHNHPDESPEISEEDLYSTQQVIEAGRLLNTPLVDHIIVHGSSYTSLRTKTTLWGTDGDS